MHSFFRGDLLFKYHIYLNALALTRHFSVSFVKDSSPQKCLKIIREKLLAIQKFSRKCEENSIFLPLLEASCQSIAGSLATGVQKTNPGLGTSTQEAWANLEKGFLQTNTRGT